MKKSEMPQASPISNNESVSIDMCLELQSYLLVHHSLRALPWIQTVASVLWALHPNSKTGLWRPSVSWTSPLQPLPTSSLSTSVPSSVQASHNSLSSFPFFTESHSCVLYSYLSQSFFELLQAYQLVAHSWALRYINSRLHPLFHAFPTKSN